MKLAVGVLPPIPTSAQRVGYGRILSIVVIVITARVQHSSGRRGFLLRGLRFTTPPVQSIQPSIEGCTSQLGGRGMADGPCPAVAASHPKSSRQNRIATQFIF
jgi:hypothetical protein